MTFQGSTRNRILQDVINRVMIVSCLIIDLASKIDNFDAIVNNHVGEMDNDMTIFVDEISDSFTDLDVTSEQLHELHNLMNNAKKLCERYQYDYTMHNFDKCYEKLERIMVSRGLLASRGT